MEKLSASENIVKRELSKQPDEQWRKTVIYCVTKCGLHFRGKDDPLTDIDFKIFLDGLRDFPDAKRVEAAFDSCLRELQFMPRLHDVRERIPDAHVENRAPDLLKVVREWDVNFGAASRLHYTEYDGGYRQVKVMPR